MSVFYTRTVAPTLKAITLAEAKAQLRLTDDASNGLIESYIDAATDEAEDALNAGVLTQTWRYDLDGFAEVIPLPKALVLQNDEDEDTAPIIQYYDTDGVLQTLDSSTYTVDTVSRPGRIVRASGQSWPAVQSDRLSGAVQITYVVGYATVAAVPERIKQGIRMYVAYLDADRDGMDVQALSALEAARRCWTDRLSHLEPSCA